DVFPHVEAWQTGGDDLVLVGAQQAPALDANAIVRRIETEPFTTALRVAWRTDDLTGFLAHFLFNRNFARLETESPGRAINTDDRNTVEFGFARRAGRRSLRWLPTSWPNVDRRRPSRSSIGFVRINPARRRRFWRRSGFVRDVLEKRRRRSRRRSTTFAATRGR